MSSDAEDESDDELCGLILPQIRQIRSRPNHFDVWNESQFYNRFRVSKQTARLLVAEIAPNIKNKTSWNHALSAEQMLLITLRFYASGNMLIAVGDFFGVSKVTVSKVIKKVSLAICLLRDKYIKIPQTEEDVSKAVGSFYRIARFPRVIAAIDCTHVKIQSPGGQNGEIFRNRKGFFSINVQVVCDADLNILDVVARWPGSCHDSTIFRNSRICGRFERGEFSNKVMVGDGGYMNKPYLMTPLRTYSNSAQARYNSAQIRTRNPIERLFGVWKRRFPVLSVGMRLDLSKIQSIIVASAILHNVCNQQREFDLPILDESMEHAILDTMDVSGNETFEDEADSSRQAIIAYFENIPN